jgi:hypothetical protein
LSRAAWGTSQLPVPRSPEEILVRSRTSALATLAADLDAFEAYLKASSPLALPAGGRILTTP